MSTYVAQIIPAIATFQQYYNNIANITAMLQVSKTKKKDRDHCSDTPSFQGKEMCTNDPSCVLRVNVDVIIL